jgi:hypothetical protein
MSILNYLKKCLSLRDHIRNLKLVHGKIRRQYLIIFRPNYVNTMRLQRVGACRGCGTCCQLGWRCYSYKPQNEQCSDNCSNYSRRFSSCRLFPIDQRDIQDRNLLAPQTPCGFSFVPAEQAASVQVEPTTSFFSIKPTRSIPSQQSYASKK